MNTKACSYMNKLSKGSCATYHAERAARLLQVAVLLEDAGRRLRQRQEATAWTTRSGRRPGRRSRPRSGAWRLTQHGRAPSGGPACASPAALAPAVAEGRSRCSALPLAWLVLDLSRARSSRCSSPGSGASTRSPARSSSDWNLDNFRLIFSPTTRPTCAIAWTTIWVAARGDACIDACSRSRSRTSWRGSRRRGMRRAAVRARPAAALVELYRPRLRVARDPRGERRAQLGARTGSACPTRTRVHATGRCGSSSRTSGCRS